MMGFFHQFAELLGSLRRTWNTGASILKNRAELAAIEWKEEQFRVVSGAIWGGVFLFSSFMAIMTIACTFLFIFWEHKLSVAVGFLIFCLIGILAAYLLRRKSIQTPSFTETLQQFKKDRTWLHGRN